MMGRRIQMRQLTQIIVLVALGIFWGAPNEANAAEQRCNALGANCLCSEPFQMTAYTLEAVNNGYNPNDTSTKQCLTNDGTTIFRPGPGNGVPSSSPPEIGSNPTVLAALPAGNTVARYMKGADGHTGIFETGYKFSSSDPTARTAIRWYLYFSPNFQFTNGACLNSGKWFTMRPGYHESSTQFGNDAPHMMYGWGGGINWTPNLDCCLVGPGYDPAANALLPRPGKWFRYEAVLTNRSGSPGMAVKVYVKDVTNNTAEYKVIDTTTACVGCGTTQDWTVASGAITALTPPALINIVTQELFRNGTCAGYQAISHLMVAGWDTDAGQRIGAALEIEGGGGTNSPPTAPVGLTIQ